MHHRLGTALVVVALVAVPVAAGVFAASRPQSHRTQPHAKTEVSGMPLIGYSAPART